MGPPAGTTGADEALRLLTAGTVDVVTEDELHRRLGRDRPLRVKLGIDPTASDLHLGFAVVLNKLRQFQDLGHLAVLIIGDFTARIGDPTGRTKTRPPLSPRQIEAHAETYLEQAGRILDRSPDRLEIRRNTEWLAGLPAEELLALAGEVTVARLLERKDFAARYREGTPISLRELWYPLLQGRDSVAVAADVELGGSDQLFNNLMGRHLQERAGQEPQVVLTTPLLEGTDGVRKMSKSYGNVVGVAEAAGEQFGKLMSIPDDLIVRYATLTTRWPPDEVERLAAELEAGALPAVEAKRRVARRVVDLYHGDGAGERAEAEFDRVFRKHAPPAEVPEHALGEGSGPVRLAHLLAAAGLVASNKEGRRMIEQGAVRLDERRIEDPDLELAATDLDGRLLRVGRRRWARIRVG